MLLVSQEGKLFFYIRNYLINLAKTTGLIHKHF